MDKEPLQKQSSLGRDFLTYLCYKSDENAGSVSFPGTGKNIFVWIDGKIVMEDDRDPPPNTVSYSGDDFTSRDLKRAIRSGKKVREARLRIEKGENTWTFTLRADRFEISGLKINMPGTDDLDERFFARIYCIEALNSLLDALYDYFIGKVHGKSWKTKGYPEFQNWLMKD